MQTERVLLRADGRPAKPRDSCNGCGIAKVKCSRDKPACTRCIGRGIQCEYGASYRSGRNPCKPPTRSAIRHLCPQDEVEGAPSTAQPDLPDAVLRSPTQLNSLNTSTASCASVAGPSSIRRSSAPMTRGGISMQPSLSNRTDYGNMDLPWPVPGQLIDHLDVGYGGASDFQMCSPFSPNMGADPTLSPQSSLLSSAPGFSPPQLGNDFSPSISLNQNTPQHTPQSVSGLHARTGNTCIANTMALIQRLGGRSLSNASDPSALFTPASSPGATRNPPSRITIEAFPQVLQSIHDIFECPCSQDEYLVSLLTLVVFRTISHYAATARTSLPTGPASTNNYKNLTTSPTELDMSSPITTTSLSEVYRVPGQRPGVRSAEPSFAQRQQMLAGLEMVGRIVEQLIRRMGELQMQMQAAASLPFGSMSGALPAGQQELGAFSPQRFQYTEAELRRRMRLLHEEVVGLVGGWE